MKILEMTLRKKWFDMIKVGAKKEEYRELKEYWRSRLKNKYGEYINYDYVHFRNGYSSDSPEFYIECKGIKIDTGYQEWGAIEGVLYFVIVLGNIVEDPRKVLRG